MKKILLISLVFCSSFIHSQTWIEIELETGLKREITIITQEQFERLLRNYEEDHGAANSFYYDVLELSPDSVPNIEGNYYLFIRRITYSGIAQALGFGNSKTGRMEIWFSEWFDIEVNSPEYRQRFDQLRKRVTGE